MAIGNFLNVLKKELTDVFPLIMDEGSNLLSDIKNDTSDMFKKFIEKCQTDNIEYLVFKEEELLDSQKLLEYAKQYKVEGANEVYVWKIKKADALYIYLAYGKDKELIKKEQNKFLIIKVEALKTDVINLFNESELVILK